MMTAAMDHVDLLVDSPALGIKHVTVVFLLPTDPVDTIIVMLP